MIMTIFVDKTFSKTYFPMKKQFYATPSVEIAEMIGKNIICASGINGTNEDFGKGEAFSFDLLETAKPF